MNKPEHDQLYHLLRMVSNLEDKDEVLAIRNATTHLLEGGYYPSLLQYLQYYGERFLLPLIFQAIVEEGWEFDRVVELGAGLGWLGRGIAAKADYKPTLFIDKRPWTLIDVVADIEKAEDRDKVRRMLKPTDLIVASELLHCLDSPKSVMSNFTFWNMAIVEYRPVQASYLSSYHTQISRYGANPIQNGTLCDILPKACTRSVRLDTHMLFLVSAGGER